MKKLLLTGFDPFGGETVNPSWEAVSRLPDAIGAYELIKLQIPTVFALAAERVIGAAETIRPDVILCVGQAGGRAGITPEVVAINLQEAKIADNAGHQPVNIPVVEGGPAAYFATVSVREMVRAIAQTGLGSSLSYSAGAFVCNDVLYRLLHRYRDTNTRVGFVHVPYLPEQAKENTPSMALEDIVKGLEAAIGVL